METALEKAKRLINDFCESEYDHGCEFKDLEHVGIAYTTTEDGKHDIQIEVDLVNYKMVALIDNKVTDEVRYLCLEDLITEELELLDFETLVAMVDYI